MELVSVVIPTYNRFQYLLETIKSIKGQTYPSIEIIVVNDKSTEPEYYSYDFGSDVKLINLKQNSKEVYGYACAAHVRNEGIKAAKGRWIAFCDDDDVWLPKKLELQIAALKESGCKMACTDGYFGDGKYNPNHSYKLYNAEFYLPKLQEVFQQKGSDLLARGFPKMWNAGLLEVHNCVITSSVVIAKELLDTIGNFRTIKNGDEDYDCWKRATKHTDIIYVEKPCFYYDSSHGDGRQYGGSGHIEHTIYTWWTGNNEMSKDRKDCLEELKRVSECNVTLVTAGTLSSFIKKEHPLHEAYQYLSETQKGDYLKAYFMNFYGGGYSDIKKTTGSWKSSFDALSSNDKWICGYAEVDGGVAYEPLKDKWKDLVGNGAYICKPNTSLTNEWYNDMIKLLDEKLEKLKLNPAKFPQNSAERSTGYPIEWNEMNGRIFHRLIYKYKEHVMNTLPISIFENYRGGSKRASLLRKQRGGADESVGFIVTRCVKKKEHNALYQNCYNAIRKFHPELKIVIIDDNSDKGILEDYEMTNTEIINSEYPAAAEFLPYYYLLERKLFKKAIIIQDSMMVNTTIDYKDVTDYMFLYDFVKDLSIDNSYTIKLFEASKIPEKLTTFMNDGNWRGDWGTCMIITYDFLQKLEDIVGIKNWKTIINTREWRFALEKAMAISCIYVSGERKQYSLYGNKDDMEVMKAAPGTYSIEMYLGDKTRFKDSIIKIWNSR